MIKNFEWSSLKQLNFYQILLAFFLPSAVAFFGFRYILPQVVENGYPKTLMWPIIASIMLLIFVIAGLLLIFREAKTNNVSVKKRLLIKNLSLKQWLICIGIMILGIMLSSAMAPLVPFFAEIPGLSIPDYMPFWLNPGIDPFSTDIEILSPSFPLKGNYSVLYIMAICILLNILAEEIYFRAWLLPKMQNYGKWSWVINAALFVAYHTFQLWLFPMMFVISLATTFTVYYSKSILPAFTIHIFANLLIGIVPIIMLIFG